MSTERPLGFVAVHLGAGYHSVSETPAYRAACRAACRAGVARLRAGGSAREVACAAVAALEDSPCTNAGTGSNLTLAGTVECEAGVMDGRTRLFGAVGAVSRVRNPVLSAQAVLEQQQAGVMTLGRVPPAVLVGRGAETWALQHGLPAADGKELITEKSAANYRRYLQRLSVAEQRQKKEGRQNSNLSFKRAETSQHSRHGAKRPRTEGALTQVQEVGNISQVTTEEKVQVQGDGTETLEYSQHAAKRSRVKGEALTQVQQQDNILQVATEEKVQVQGDGNVLQNCYDAIEEGNVTKDSKTVDSTSQRAANRANSLNHEEKALGYLESNSQGTMDSDIRLDTVGAVAMDTIDSDIRLDTVGAVAMDTCGNVSAAVSSGGLALKQPGRLGHAAMYGCGCWAVQERPLSVACSTTGCGEHIMQTMLAKECAEALLQGDDTHSLLSDVLKSKFLHSPSLRHVDKKVGGVIVLRCEEVKGEADPSVELLWAHTADSMCVGFMSTRDDRPTVRMSRLPEGQRSGQAVVTEGYSVR